MTKYRVKTANGFPSCSQEWEEETDLTKEEFLQELYEAECEKISVSVEEVIPEPPKKPIIWTDELILDLAYDLAQNSSGSMSGWHHPNNWDEIPEQIQVQIEEQAYSYSDACGGCGWTFIEDELEHYDLAAGEGYCWRCARDLEDELNEQEDEEDV